MFFFVWDKEIERLSKSLSTHSKVDEKTTRAICKKISRMKGMRRTIMPKEYRRLFRQDFENISPEKRPRSFNIELQ